jgi:hypothetical protein
MGHLKAARRNFTGTLPDRFGRKLLKAKEFLGIFDLPVSLLFSILQEDVPFGVRTCFGTCPSPPPEMLPKDSTWT